MESDSGFDEPVLLGRAWVNSYGGPAVVTVRNGIVYDITSKSAPTVAHVCELPDALRHIQNVQGRALGSLEEICDASLEKANEIYLLAPCDLQAIKACGVTFAGSMVERVIEEQAAGDPVKAQEIRDRLGERIGSSLRNVVPGSAEAATVKKTLIEEGLWSQYLEVGIGPDAEIFSKAQVLSSVGHNAKIGLHSGSKWNNPEPEIVLAVSSTGKILGATLGNDVNLRDFEGRSALLLSKAKDNNASCAIGPFIRFFDEGFTLDHVRNAELALKVHGLDGFQLEGHSSMEQISRDPTDLVAQTIGAHHQYPDGFMLFLGTLFAPTMDRDNPGEGFTHKVGDVVSITALGLGTITNTVETSQNCAPWTFGIRDLMSYLARSDLI